MTKEQEEAIKKLEHYLQNSVYKKVDSDFFENNWEVVNLEIPQAIETVLSMLKEKDKEIESLEKTLDEKYIFVTGARTLYAGLMSLDKENIVKDDLKLRNEIYQHIEDKEKKDKQIDLMAEYIATLDIDEDICMNNKINSEWCNEDYTNCKKCIKQYFERKCEE